LALLLREHERKGSGKNKVEIYMHSTVIKSDGEWHEMVFGIVVGGWNLKWVSFKSCVG
jgi:hypothetical protein